MTTICINPKSDTPREPAPFSANGRPCWSAVLPAAKVVDLSKVWEKPSQKFQREIDSVFVDGIQVYPKP